MVLTPTGNDIPSIVDGGGTSLSVVSEITDDRGVSRRSQRTLNDARINTILALLGPKIGLFLHQRNHRPN